VTDRFTQEFKEWRKTN